MTVALHSLPCTILQNNRCRSLGENLRQASMMKACNMGPRVLCKMLVDVEELVHNAYSPDFGGGRIKDMLCTLLEAALLQVICNPVDAGYHSPSQQPIDCNL